VGQLQAGQSEEQVLSQILGSTEFYNRAQSSSSGQSQDQNYVQALYQVLLGRTPTGAEVDGWVAHLAGMGRQGVALAILRSRETRSDLFEGYYNALLHRPDDPAGLAGWLGGGVDAHTARLLFESGSEFFANG
jgi:hypothetical protein